MLTPEPVQFPAIVTITQLVTPMIGGAGFLVIHMRMRASWQEIRAIFRRPTS